MSDERAELEASMKVVATLLAQQKIVVIVTLVQGNHWNQKIPRVTTKLDTD